MHRDFSNKLFWGSFFREMKEKTNSLNWKEISVFWIKELHNTEDFLWGGGTEAKAEFEKKLWNVIRGEKICSFLFLGANICACVFFGSIMNRLILVHGVFFVACFLVWYIYLRFFVLRVQNFLTCLCVSAP